MNAGWIDSHCHWDFDDLQKQSNQLLSLMAANDVITSVIPAVCVESAARMMEIARRDSMSFALGLHPYFIERHSDDAWTTFQHIFFEQKNKQDCIAVGECGLDRPTAEANIDQVAWQTSSVWHRQTFLFEEQIKLAKSADLPLIVHARRTNDECCSILRRQNFTQGGIVHAFSGSIQQADQWRELGFKVGLGGAFSHERAQKLRRVVAALPDDAFVLETDAPDMTPAFCAKGANSPLMIPLTAHIISSLRNQPLHEIQKMAFVNTLAALPKLRLNLRVSERCR